MSSPLDRVVDLLLARIFPPYTPMDMLHDVQKYFDFLFGTYGYFIYTCYFDRFDYWDVLLVSHAERLGIWVSSERYITLYLCLPAKGWGGFATKAISVQEAIATAVNSPALRESCGYKSGGRGIKRCAQFLKKYYPILRSFAEEKGWLLEKSSLEEIKKEAPLVGHWKYEKPCWVREDK